MVNRDGSDTVVMLVALDLEYQAVRRHLTGLHPHRHPAGTLFEVGQLPGGRGRVAIAVTGEGNRGAAVLTERAITEFQPAALLFIGVAGGLKDDIGLGDVVVGTKVYAYHGGKDEDTGFLARPAAWPAPYALEQLARYIARNRSWHRLLAPDARRHPPAVHLKPIAAGEVTLNSRTTPLAQQLHRNYNDAVAIEMESAGVAQAGHLNGSLPVLTVRGISDKADGGKHLADEKGWQPIAAANAAAFAVSLAVELTTGHVRPEPESSVGSGAHPGGATERGPRAPDVVTDERAQPGGLRWARDRRLLPLAGTAVVVTTLGNATGVLSAGDLFAAGYLMARFALLFIALWLVGRPGRAGAVGIGMTAASTAFLLAHAMAAVHDGGSPSGWLELFTVLGWVGLLAVRFWPFSFVPRQARVVPPTRRPVAYCVLGSAGVQVALLFVALPPPDLFYEPFTLAEAAGLPAALLAVVPMAGLCAAAALTAGTDDVTGPAVAAATWTYFGPEMYFLLSSLILGPGFTYLGANVWREDLNASWFVLLQAVVMCVTAVSTTVLVRQHRSVRQPLG
jgi:adenosylhomocysteine nucleosidase